LKPSRDFHKSRAVAWLFLLATLTADASEQVKLGPPLILPLPLEGVRGISLAMGAGGEIIELAGPTPRLLIWNEVEEFTGEFQPSEDRNVVLVDIADDAGFGFLAVDPLIPIIHSFGRRGEARPGLPLISKTVLEPISVCSGENGTIYLLNQKDGDIWRVDRDGRATPLLIPSQFKLRSSNSQLVRQPNRSLIWLLNGDRIISASYGGQIKRIMEIQQSSSVDHAVTGDLLWVVGDGLMVLSSESGEVVGRWDSEAMKAWGIITPVSIAGQSTRLAILCEDGKVALFHVDLP